MNNKNRRVLILKLVFKSIELPIQSKYCRLGGEACDDEIYSKNIDADTWYKLTKEEQNYILQFYHDNYKSMLDESKKSQQSEYPLSSPYAPIKEIDLKEKLILNNHPLVGNFLVELTEKVNELVRETNAGF